MNQYLDSQISSIKKISYDMMRYTDSTPVEKYRSDFNSLTEITTNFDVPKVTNDEYFNFINSVCQIADVNESIKSDSRFASALNTVLEKGVDAGMQYNYNNSPYNYLPDVIYNNYGHISLALKLNLQPTDNYLASLINDATNIYKGAIAGHQLTSFIEHNVSIEESIKKAAEFKLSSIAFSQCSKKFNVYEASEFLACKNVLMENETLVDAYTSQVRFDLELAGFLPQNSDF